MASLGLQAADANYQVVPLPQNIALEKGAPFVLSGNTAVVVEGTDEAMQRNAAFLKQFVRETTGITLAGMGKKGTTITLKLSNKVANAEGYVITVKPRAIVIEGKTPQGVF